MLFEKGEKVGGYIIICLVREFNGIVINKLKIMNFLFLSKFFYLLKMGLFFITKISCFKFKTYHYKNKGTSIHELYFLIIIKIKIKSNLPILHINFL